MPSRAHLDVVELLQTHAALVAAGYLANVVLESLERGDLILEDHDTVTNHADLRLAGDLAVLHVRACDKADIGYARNNMKGLSFEKGGKALCH